MKFLKSINTITVYVVIAKNEIKNCYEKFEHNTF